MGMAGQDEVEALPLVGAGPLRPVGEEDGEILPRRPTGGAGKLRLPDVCPNRRIVNAADVDGLALKD